MSDDVTKKVKKVKKVKKEEPKVEEAKLAPEPKEEVKKEAVTPKTKIEATAKKIIKTLLKERTPPAVIYSRVKDKVSREDFDKYFEEVRD